MKKFYTLVSKEKSGAGWAVHLDGKPVKTPAGTVLSVPGEKVADEIVKEWAAQEDNIIPDSMPLTQLLITAQEQVARERESMSEKTLAYLDTDLLCYRTDMPEDLAARQAESWNPPLDWFCDHYGAALQTTTGLQALAQNSAAHDAVRRDVQTLDDFQFCILQLVTALSGSLVLALAFIHSAIRPEQVFEAAHIEELYKAEIYNEAAHGAATLQQKKQDAMRRDLAAARKFLDLLEL